MIETTGCFTQNAKTSVRAFFLTSLMAFSVHLTQTLTYLHRMLIYLCPLHIKTIRLYFENAVNHKKRENVDLDSIRRM